MELRITLNTNESTLPVVLNLSLPYNNTGDTAGSSDGYFVDPLFRTLGLVTGLLGTLANSLMLFVLSYFKENRQHTTNILILNQTALDLLGCLALALGYTLQFCGVQFHPTALGYVLCWFFYGTILMGVGMIGSIVGLVLVAVERYVKIMHSSFYTRHHRPWVTKILVALPWGYGFIVMIPLNVKTAVITEGKCYSLALWSTPIHKFIYLIYAISFNYIIPVVIIIFCYARIGLLLLRRTRESRKRRSSSVKPLPKLSGRRASAVQSILAVATVFALCWLPFQICFSLLVAGYPMSRSSNVLAFSIMLAYMNPVLDPIMYAWRYETVRDSTRRILERLREVLTGRSTERSGIRNPENRVGVENRVEVEKIGGVEEVGDRTYDKDMLAIVLSTNASSGTV